MFVIFGILIFLLPFNGFPYGKSIFGELSVEFSSYIGFVLILAWLIKLFINKERIYFFKDNLFNYTILSFYIWTFLSFIVNYSQISISNLKGRTGFERFILQELVITFCIIFSLSFYNIINSSGIKIYQLFYKIKKIIFLNFILVFIWGFFEFINKFTDIYSFDTLKKIDCLLSISCNNYQDRLKFFTGEPSWFGIYLIFALPFFVFYIKNFKNRFFTYFFFLLFLFLFFAYFTFSRTVYIVVVFELFIIFITYVYRFIYQKNLFKDFREISVFLIFSILVFNLNFSNLIAFYEKNLKLEKIKNSSFLESFSDNSYYTQSNKTRKTMQMVGIKIAIDNPIFGVGLGQYAFHAINYLDQDVFNPNSVKYNLEIYDYFKKDKIWASAHGLFARISAELGFVGFILWISIWINLLYKLFVSLKSKLYTEEKMILMIIIISLQLLNFVSDTFRFLIYWLTISLSLVLLDKEKYENIY